MAFQFSSWAQPNKLWATYLGGFNNTFYHWGTQVLYDTAGYLYVVGLSTDEDIASPNSFKPYITNLTENFLSKFDTTGQMIWSTFLGSDGIGSIANPRAVIDHNGDIIVLGQTAGVLNTIGTPGTYRPNCFDNDTLDFYFMVKFNGNGQKLWGTYLGPAHQDSVKFVPRDITLDNNNNILVCGNTTPGFLGIPFDFPPSNAYQTQAANPHSYNAFMMKFDPAGQLMWGSYYGDTQNDVGLYIECDQQDQIYLVGTTQNTSGIADSNAFFPNKRAMNYDYFVAKFNADGSRMWGTYTNGLDVRGGILIDDESNFYLSGISQFDTGIATQGIHQSTLLGDQDLFLSKWNQHGQRIWTTYYGGEGIEYSSGWSLNLLNPNFYSSNLVFTYIATFDTEGNIVMVGGTSSETHINQGCTYAPVNKDYDGFMAKFNPHGHLIWGSYYDVQLSSIAHSNKDNTFYTLSNTSVDSLATPGVYQETKPSNANSILISKMQGDYFCPQLNISIQNNNGLLSIPPQYADYQWHLNGQAINGAQSFSYQVENAGNYWVTFQNGCDCYYSSDTLYVEAPSSIQEPEFSEFALQLYPNPTKNFFHLKGKAVRTNSKLQLKMKNILGQAVWQESYALQDKKEIDLKIEIPSLPAGMYFLEWQYEKHKDIIKLILQ